MLGPGHPARATCRTLATSAVMALAALLATGCGGDGAPAPSRPDAPRRAPVAPADPPVAPDDVAAAATTLADVPVEQLIGDLIMTKLAGPTATAEELETVRSLGFGGVILFGPNVVDETQLRALTGSLRTARASAATAAGLPPGVLVSVDQEGGDIRNVPFAPPERTQPQLASEGPPAGAQEAARRTGEALHDLGISIDLGPVADLAAPPNRTMAGRAFGEVPEEVTPYVVASARGLEAGGVAATVKHFPGFGASSANSDEAVAYVDRSRAELLATELQPFRAAIDADVDVVMVSHGVHRRLGGTLPGTLDPAIATGLLREELGFEGVAMTDSMNARGFREAWGDTVPRSCPVALGAGIDLLLLTGTIETARLCRARILDALRDGTLPEARVREAAQRVAELRERVAAG